MTNFKQLGLKAEIIKGLDELNFSVPTPIQEKVIPQILGSSQDLIALAQTGTGKTAAFGLPILERIGTGDRSLQTLILCPTRELALQIYRDLARFAKPLKNVTIIPVYGGEKIDIQIRSVRQGAHIVVGTPGRVHDLIRRKILKLDHISQVVLDEADEMLDMGFKKDLDAILAETPQKKQVLLFSATFSKSISAIARKYMQGAKEINAGPRNAGVKSVAHEYYIVDAKKRFESLQRVLDSLPQVYGIIFCRTKHQTQEVADKLKATGYASDALHGDISQDNRTKIMDKFKCGQIRLLVATDVAARGIDVNNLSHVINYNLPDQNEAYIHRSGRTGRAEQTGISTSILTPAEAGRIKGLEKAVGFEFTYKQVPSGEDVCLRQLDYFAGRLAESGPQSEAIEPYLPLLMERLSGLDKEELIKRVAAEKLSVLLDAYSNAPDLNSQARKNRKYELKDNNRDSVDLEINLGRQQGFDVKQLFSFVNRNRKLSGIEIGRISLRSGTTVFSVPKDRAGQVTMLLGGGKFRGRVVSVKKAAVGSSSNDYKPVKKAGKSRKRYK